MTTPACACTNTEQLRAMNMGALELGDPFVGLKGVIVPEGKSLSLLPVPEFVLRV